MPPSDGERLARIETLLEGVTQLHEQVVTLGVRVGKIERFLWLGLGVMTASVGSDSLAALVGAAV